MNSQHLSDEAVAACADGVLRGHARERATRHIAQCAECANAVQVQREAAWALRAAPAPSLPSGLVDRLRGLPGVTPLAAPPTVLAPDGSTMFSTASKQTVPSEPMLSTKSAEPMHAGKPMLSTVAPLAALVPAASATRPVHRSRPFVATAAVVALAGALTAGAMAARGSDAPLRAGTGNGDQRVVRDPGTVLDIAPGNAFTNVSVYRPGGR